MNDVGFLAGTLSKVTQTEEDMICDVLRKPELDLVGNVLSQGLYFYGMVYLRVSKPL